MKSIFKNTDETIANALALEANQSLKQKSTCLSLKSSPEILYQIENLVFELFSRIEENWMGRVPSPMNWKLRRKTNIDPDNKSPEVLLERAIVILADRGLLDGWYNQLPIASGLIDEKSDKRAAVDLIKTGEGYVELVELKWGSDTPAYAAFEILRYGLAFLFCYQKQQDFSYHNYPLMQTKKLSLRVLAPQEYYGYCNLGFVRMALEAGLKRLFHEKTGGALEVDFLFLAFPHGFTLPFKIGQEVSDLRHLPVDAYPVAAVMEAIHHSQPIWGYSE